MSHHVYLILDPISAEPRWVGTTTNPANRLYHHISSNDATKNWINSLSVRPILRSICITTKEEAARIESALIRRFRGKGIPLLNRNEGGQGPGIGKNLGRGHSAEARELMSLGQAASWTPERHTKYQETIRRRRKEAHEGEEEKAGAKAAANSIEVCDLHGNGIAVHRDWP